MFTFSDLVQYQRKGFRNDNWRRLGLLDKAYFRVSICYAKARGKIVNSRVVDNLKSIIEKLIPNFSKQVMRAGFRKVKELIIIFKENMIFEWAPETIEWLQDHKYIFWLGLCTHEGWLTS